MLDDTLFSRSTGLPAHMGKATCSIKTLVPDVVADELARVCNAQGIAQSEFVRDAVMVALYGREKVLSLYQARFTMLAGIGPNAERIEGSAP